MNDSAAAKINKQREQRIRDWRLVSCGLFIVIVLLVFENIRARENLWVWSAPDITVGQKLQNGQPNAAYVYGFAHTVLAGISRWKEDGEREYKDNIERYSNYLSKELRQQLRVDYDKRRNPGPGMPNELKNRSREISLIDLSSPDKYVVAISASRYHVYLDVYDEERLGGTQIKFGSYRYVLEVVLDTSNFETNGTGLRVAGFVSKPERIK